MAQSINPCFGRKAVTLGTLVLVAACTVSPLQAAKKEESAPWPEITEQERSLKSVPQDPEAGAVILRRTRDGKIDDKAQINELDYHWRIKVLNDRGKQYAEVQIPSQKVSQVSHIEARTIKSDGTIVTVAADQIFEKLVEKGRGYQLNEFVFNFPGVEPGSILEYRYHRRSRILLYIEPWYFAGDEFTLFSRVSQAVPTDLSYRVLCDKCPNPGPDTIPWEEGKAKGRRVTMEMKDIPAYKDELMMPPVVDVSPRLEMVLTAWAHVAWDALGRDDKLFTDWESVAKFSRFYYQKAYKVDEVAMKQTVVGWTQAVSDPTEKIKAIYRHIQEDFKYQPSEDIYVQTRSIADILKKKTADNEEKAILLVAALRSIGVVGNLTFVVGKQKGTLYTNYPSLSQFSHIIVAVPQPDGSALWLDPTITYAPFGFMPWQDSGAGALYMTETGSALINLPKKDEASATHFDVTVKVRPDGKADLDVVAQYEGEDAIEQRQDLVPASETARIKVLQDWLNDARPGALLKTHEFENLDAIDKPLRIKMTIEAPDLVTKADELVLVRGCVLDCRESNPIPSRTRQYPFSIDPGWNRAQNVTIIPPEGMKMTQPAQPLEAKSIIGSMTFSCSAQADGSARCTRRFTVPRGQWPASMQNGIRMMYDKIVEADRSTVAFEKKTQGAAGGGR